MSVTSLLQRAAAINHLMMLGTGGPPLGYILKLAAVRRGTGYTDPYSQFRLPRIQWPILKFAAT